MYVAFIIFLFIFLYKRNQILRIKYAYIKESLVLIAFILKVDNELSVTEQKYISRFLLRKYGARRQKRFLKLLSFHIKNKTPIKLAISKINSEVSMTVKLQILHLLIKICIVDNYLKDSELIALSEITKKLDLTYFQLNSILAMHSYVSEKAEREKRKYKRQSVKFTISKQNWALSILELDLSATDSEIKKGYRKLVVLYHPDKTMHLDNHLRKGAKEMFQKVNDAYDFLKQKKKFK
jgi:DnaJ like chaperone protein